MRGSIAVLFFVLSLSWGQNLAGDRGSCDRCDARLDCDCSGSGLTAVPMVTDRALTLDLSFNNIMAIKDGDLSGHRQLKALSLHANRVSRIDPKALWSLWSLEELDLSQNRLTSLNHRWFSKLGALQQLKLHNNPYRHLGSPAPFQTLFRLKSLSFGGDALEEIRRTDLKDVAGLDELHVDANNLKRYESGALANIWPLGRVTLSLRSAFLSNQSLATAVLRDVSYPETLLVLENIDLSNNRSVLPFREVAQRRVRHLALHNFVLTDESFVALLEVIDGAPLASTTLVNVTLKGVGKYEAAVNLSIL